jgi:hypothetical protein
VSLAAVVLLTAAVASMASQYEVFVDAGEDSGKDADTEQHTGTALGETPAPQPAADGRDDVHGGGEDPDITAPWEVRGLPANWEVKVERTFVGVFGEPIIAVTYGAPSAMPFEGEVTISMAEPVDADKSVDAALTAQDPVPVVKRPDTVRDGRRAVIGSGNSAATGPVAGITWSETPDTTISIVAVGMTEDQVRDLAENLVVNDH